MKKILYLSAFILTLSSVVALAEYETKSSPNFAKASYDIQFLDTMIAHHEQGIAMSEIALGKSQNEMIKNKAQMMMDNQKSEVTKLQLLRNEVDKNAAPAINMSLSGMREEDLRMLRAQGPKSFDEKFLKMSISHDEGGLRMSRDAARRAKISKVQVMARNISDSQAAEIMGLQEMLKNKF